MSSLDARDLLPTKNRFFRLRVRREVGFGERLQYQARMSSRMDYTILDDCSNKKYIHAKERVASGRTIGDGMMYLV